MVLENGSMVPNKELVKSTRRRKSFAFCSDTIYDESIIPYIQKVDILYHESTYMHKDIEFAIKYMHTTSRQAATIANKANVGKLILGHFSSRYPDLELMLVEAHKTFSESCLAKEGQTYSYNE